MIFTPTDPLELETRYTVTVGDGHPRPRRQRDVGAAARRSSSRPPAARASQRLVPGRRRRGRATRRADRAHLLDAHGHRIGRGRAAPATRPSRTSCAGAASCSRSCRTSRSSRIGTTRSPSRPRPPDVCRRDAGESALDAHASRRQRPGLGASVLVPADGIDGIAPTSPIAVIFDRPVDPGSVSGELLTITPEVAGILEVVAAAGDEPQNRRGRRALLRFAPSGPLPANTTFEVELGNRLHEPVRRWDGRAADLDVHHGRDRPETLSNQIAFLTDRAGVTNVWAMNPDGTAAAPGLGRADTPMLDYAVAPDGSSLVVGDGRRLVLADAAGSATAACSPMTPSSSSTRPMRPTGSASRSRAPTPRPALGLGLWEQVVGGGEADAPSSSTASRALRPNRRPRTRTASRRMAARAALRARWRVARLRGPGRLGRDPRARDRDVIMVRYEAIAPPAWLADGSGDPAHRSHSGRPAQRLRVRRSGSAPGAGRAVP